MQGVIEMRVDSLARDVDRERIALRGLNLHTVPADELHKRNVAPLAGRDIAAAFGPLMYYSETDALDPIFESGFLGRHHGVWLTTSPYAACVAPAALGLNGPRDVVLYVDVSGVAKLWGPGFVRPSAVFARQWTGGAVEFFSPAPLPVAAITGVAPADPCGD